MFNTGIIVGLRRVLGQGQPPVAAFTGPSGGSADPAPAPTSNPFLRDDLDWEALAAAAPTRFEQLYYRHKGKVVFKWRQYLRVYDALLAPYVGKPITLVEVGVAAGGSIQLWREYLGPQARIIGVDIDPGTLAHAGPGVEIMVGDQGNADFLRQVAERAGPIDVLIEDGSHQVDHQILTFETLFPRVKTGGVYVCEDLHTSYWDNFGGGAGKPGTFIEYLKTMLDRMHWRYNGMPVGPDDLVRHVQQITMADSIAVFHKGEPEDTYMVQVGG